MVDEFNYMLFLNAITLGKKKEWCYKENKGVLIALLIPFHLTSTSDLFVDVGLSNFGTVYVTILELLTLLQFP